MSDVRSPDAQIADLLAEYCDVMKRRLDSAVAEGERIRKQWSACLDLIGNQQREIERVQGELTALRRVHYGPGTAPSLTCDRYQASTQAFMGSQSFSGPVPSLGNHLSSAPRIDQTTDRGTDPTK